MRRRRSAISLQLDERQERDGVRVRAHAGLCRRGRRRRMSHSDRARVRRGGLRKGVGGDHCTGTYSTEGSRDSSTPSCSSAHVPMFD